MAAIENLKKAAGNPIVLTALAIALGFGAWGAYRGSIGCNIRASLVGTLFCPVANEYASAVTPEVLAEIARRQRALRSRLKTYSGLLALLSVALATGCLACLCATAFRTVRPHAPTAISKPSAFANGMNHTNEMTPNRGPMDDG